MCILRAVNRRQVIILCIEDVPVAGPVYICEYYWPTSVNRPIPYWPQVTISSHSNNTSTMQTFIWRPSHWITGFNALLIQSSSFIIEQFKKGEGVVKDNLHMNHFQLYYTIYSWDFVASFESTFTAGISTAHFSRSGGKLWKEKAGKFVKSTRRASVLVRFRWVFAYFCSM